MEVKALTGSEAERAAEVLVEAFVVGNPYNWSRAVGRDVEAFGEWVRKSVVPEAVERGRDAGGLRSVVAVDAAASKDVVGVLTLEPFAPSVVSAPSDAPLSMRLIEALRARGEALFLDGLKAIGMHRTPPHRVAYFAFLATRADQRRRGVSRELIRAGVAEALRAPHRFDFCMALCSSPKSAAAFRQCGFACWGAVVYSAATFPDITASTTEAPFRSLPDQMSVMVMRLAFAP